MNGIVVFSPNRYSLYTICVTEMLRREGVPIQAVFVRRMLNPGRFFSEFSRDGTRLLKKVWKKLFLRRKAYQPANYETISDLLQKEGITFGSIDALGRSHGIPVITCKTLNDEKVVASLKEIRPDLVVFTGGGLIRREVLENAGAGVLNCHSGVLPPYRGMDVVEWPILEGRLDQIGMTVHFMDAGIDTGDILRVRKVKIERGETIREIREKIEASMCREMAQTCLNTLRGKSKRVSQKRGDGRQYFVMHPRLISLAEEKLNQKDSRPD
jgi:methionyl-tRNA formyltransferase